MAAGLSLEQIIVARTDDMMATSPMADAEMPALQEIDELLAPKQESFMISQSRDNKEAVSPLAQPRIQEYKYAIE